jgi:hypothetical protein
MGESQMKKMKRDIQGKFAIKNSDYREVRSVRLTSDTWKELGIASECLGLSKADYLEEIVRKKLLPCITRNSPENLPSITPYEQEIETLKVQVQNLQFSYSVLKEQSAITKVHEVVDYEAVRDRILSELKLGRQAHGYKTAQKALNRMIAQLKLLAERF